MSVDNYETLRPSDSRRSVSDLVLEYFTRVGILKRSSGVSITQIQQLQVDALRQEALDITESTSKTRNSWSLRQRFVKRVLKLKRDQR